MIDATIACGRMHDLAGLGRSCLAEPGGAGLRRQVASCRQSVTAATSSGDVLPPRPRATSSRPDGNDLMASII